MDLQLRNPYPSQRSAEIGASRPHAVAWGVIIAACTIVALHGALLAASIPDYRVTIDSAYHVSMARVYATQWIVPWDHINFGPGGRPNLQGPLFPMAIAALGRILGGRGNDFVQANAILAVVQWFCAIATAGFFAMELGGEFAMLFATAILSGAAFASGSFAVGIPSGWLFILTPWAIYFFLRGRTVASAITTSAAIYVHIGGYLTTPIGIIIAAVLTRRWRQLFTVGFITFVLTFPYTFHIVSYLGWLSGVKSHAALLFDPMLDVLALIGIARMMRRPRDNVFMLSWVGAPIAWAVQDPGRFILQSALAGSVVAALLLVDWIGRFEKRRTKIAFAAAIAVLATIAPFGPPSLVSEIAWDAGVHYPRAVNWNHARELADILKENDLTNRLVSDYSPAVCPAMAVYAPISCEKGHWVEVQPPHDPADNLPAADKTYILPMRSDDPELAEMEKLGWLSLRGAAGDSTVVTLAGKRPSVEDAAKITGPMMEGAAQWLAAHAVNNELTLSDWRTTLSRPALQHFRERLRIQRDRTGRMELAAIVYAWALEPVAPSKARQMRRVARGFGVIAGVLGDDFELDFLSNARFDDLERSLTNLATTLPELEKHPVAGRAVMDAFDRVLGSALEMHGHTFAERPPGDPLPWMP